MCIRDRATLDELAAAINGAGDNTGVKATLVRSNGRVNLVLTSDKTGADLRYAWPDVGLADPGDPHPAGGHRR